jgi:NADPH:quinone reductase-like Zn-dependent oxidoreductase
VTAVCSTANVELVRSLGATHVIDYTTADFTQNGQKYDVIVDTVGTAPYSRIKASLGEGGRLLQILGTLADLLVIPWILLTTKHKVIGGVALGSQESLQFLAQLAEAGDFKPVIDRRYPLEQIAEAHRYGDTGRKRGNIVITVG